jgi:hypothetical protein
MPRVDSAGRATAVVNTHYPKKLISISRQDCVAGAHICLPTRTIRRLSCRVLFFFGCLTAQSASSIEIGGGEAEGVASPARFSRADGYDKTGVQFLARPGKRRGA